MEFWVKLGPFGVHQWLFIIGHTICQWLIASETFAPTFVAIKPAFYCADWLPSEYNASQSVDLFASAPNLSIINQCHHPHFNVSCAPDQWRFDQRQRTETLFSEFHLICGNTYLVAVGTSIYMAGLFCGSLLLGHIADKWGRYPCYLLCSVCIAVSAVSLPFIRNYVLFLVARFVFALFACGTWIIRAAFMSELTIPQYRIFFGLLNRSFGWDVGCLIGTMLAYFIRGYQWLLLAYAGLAIFYFWPFLFFYESPLWLMSVGKRKQAMKVCQKIAKRNGKHITDAEMNSLLDTVENSSSNVKKASKSMGVFSVLAHSKYRFILLTNWMHFFTSSMVYYAIGLGAAYLGGNLYLNCSLMYCLDLVILIPLYVWGKTLPRRLVMMFLYGFGCVLCVASSILMSYADSYEGVYRIALIVCSIMGRTMLSMTFLLNWTYSAEVFPTVVRSSSVGSCSAIARIGGILAPMVLVLKSVWLPLPFLIFASLSGLSSFLCYFIPETCGMVASQTLEDVELQEKYANKNSN